jgi:hypothetical protein
VQKLFVWFEGLWVEDCGVEEDEAAFEALEGGVVFL